MGISSSTNQVQRQLRIPRMAYKLKQLYSCRFQYQLMKHISIVIILLLSLKSQGNELNETIECINDYVQSYKSKMSSRYFDIFVNAFPNTMSTTVQHFNIQKGNESTYIITGDIEAMWLRDSTNQFIPYIRMAKNCMYMPALTRGLINTQAEFIMTDTYTNAFKKFEQSKEDRPNYLNDKSQKLVFGIPVDLCRGRQFATPSIWQRKFEIDSPAAFLRLTHQYYQRFNNIDFMNINYFKALERIVTLIDEETKDDDYETNQGQKFYTFYRDGNELPGGKIKFAVSTGMVKTGFRPSDSPNELPYNIPGNAMLATYLQLVASNILNQVNSSSVYHSWSLKLSQKMSQHAQNIKKAIYRHGVIRFDGTDIFAYEVDGLGNYRIYDDANLPSILSLPYLGFVDINDEIYQNTRAFIFSAKDKYFYSKGTINGVGSSHTERRYIWPLALITTIMTSKSKIEIKNCLDNLLLSAKNNLMHESFSIDEPQKITRDWFAWANSFFGEMVVYLVEKYPDLLL